MTIQNESRLSVTCAANCGEIDLHIQQLKGQGKNADTAIEILTELGKCISRLDEATGTINLVVELAKDGSISRKINLGPGHTEKVDQTDARNIPLENLHLDTRMTTICLRLGAKTLGDIADKSESDLAGIRNCGTHSIDAFRRLLMQYGLSLKSKFDVQTP